MEILQPSDQQLLILASQIKTLWIFQRSRSSDQCKAPQISQFFLTKTKTKKTDFFSISVLSPMAFSAVTARCPSLLRLPNGHTPSISVNQNSVSFRFSKLNLSRRYSVSVRSSSTSGALICFLKKFKINFNISNRFPILLVIIGLILKSSLWIKLAIRIIYLFIQIDWNFNLRLISF